jgi:uncharacterized protein (TIGR02391 family)
MGKYDVMQVCLNGHTITDRYRSAPEFRQSKCGECGEDTIHRCPECNEPIRGRYQVEGVVNAMGTKSPKPYCHECGEAYPWTDDTEQFTDVDSAVLDDELAARALTEYEDGHYQSAVQTSFVVLEERVRDVGGFRQSKHGAELMTDAFRPGGPLAVGETESEKEGTMLLFRGSVMALRNPVSHRFTDEIDQEYARDVIHTVNLLLRVIRENN